ncbi:MAG: alpha/beta hydrolase [Chloroflexi bacterium]|nr:alpha/beta hydrolase [Chloroflexota bacterium]
MPDVNLGDVTIHYQEAGEGPLAYVYCHSLGGNSEDFVQEFDFWKKHFGRVITWDNRGRGESSQAKKYSLPLYASDLARLLDGLGIEKAVVHGFSWGGVLVQQFALDYPEKCAAIIVDSSSSEVNLAASERWYQVGEAAKLRTGDRGMKPEHLESFVASARAVASLREQPLTPRLKSITCPVLIVVGAGDVSTGGPAGAVIMSRQIPNNRLQIFEGVEHAVYLQQQEGFRKLVLAFCREQGILRGD